jgi:preprotein translocase SecE subunit
MDTFIQYLKDTFAEMKHVSWPTQHQAIVYTALVIGVSALVAVFVSVLDFSFSHGLDWFLK